MNAAAALSRDALMPRRPAGMGVGLVLALLAHALLVAALAFSVRWKASEPAGIEAELWAAVPQIAAPRAAAPEPAPAPVEVKPSPPPPPPPPKVEPTPTPVPDAQIAIEKARREEQKREELRREALKREEEKREADKREQTRREEARREEEKKKAEDKREQARLDQQRAKEELDRKRKEQAAKAKQDADLAAIRQANLERMMGQAGATGAPNSTGTAARSAGPSAGYAGRIRARIQPNIVFADNVSGNPLATVEVRAAPDGTIVGMRLVKSSGVKAWDDAVLRAVEKTEVLPRDTDGRVPAKFEIDFRPRD